MFYPKNFEEKVGFDRIRKMILDTCLCDLGRELTAEMHFSTSADEITILLQQTDEFRKILLLDQDFPLDHFFDVTPSLKKLRIEGSYLEAEEFLQIRKSQGTIRSILAFLSKEDHDYPALKGLSRDIVIYPFVLDSIDKILNNKGEVKDKASQELASIRRALREKEKQASARLNQILKQAISDGIVERGVNLAIRDGRAVIPVNSSNKRRISGLVHDESASGRTAYIEPSEIVELNNEIRELEYAEKREIIRILLSLTNDIRPYTEDLFRSYEFLGQIDFTRAKALVARKLNAVLPAFGREPALNWERAIHPLLFRTEKPEEKEVVPLDIFLNDETRLLLISGPNAGGKSVCLQTVGLLQYMLQSGMLVPVLEDSEFGLFTQLFIEIGDEQSIENDLSTYSSHLVNMKYYLKNANPNTLILIDEFGTGTEPMLGGAIAESMLGKLIKTGTYGVITTHYTNLKHFAASEPGIENGAMLFDRQKMEPLFQLEIGRPGSSFAFEIARKIGLPEDVLTEATEKAGEDHIKFDRHLQEIARDKRYWENKRSRIRKSEKKLEELVGKYSVELEQVKQLRKEIIERAELEAKELLAGVNKVIENTIRKIKEANAEREVTKKAREELEQFTKTISDSKRETDKKIERKITRLRKSARQPGKTESNKKATVRHGEDIRVGDKVKMTGYETPGEVIDRNEKSYLVSFGNMKTTLPAEKLTKICENEFRRVARREPQDPATLWDIGKRKLAFSPQIDLRGVRTEEAIRRVTEFIDEAIVVEIDTLRILHGKGDGILRQMIREYLNTVDIVKSFRDEQIDQGGSGITVVELDL